MDTGQARIRELEEQLAASRAEVMALSIGVVKLALAVHVAPR